MQELHMTVMIEDDQKCQECFAPVVVDVEEIKLHLGSCPNCGNEIFLYQQENFEWGVEQ